MSSRSIIFLAAIACASPKNDASDTATTLPAVDTLKPATDTLTSRDTVAAGHETTPVTGTKTPPPATKRRDSIIGRDSTAPLNPKNPLLDTVKRRPPL